MTSHSNEHIACFGKGRRLASPAVIIAAAALLIAPAVPASSAEMVDGPAGPRSVRLTPEQVQAIRHAPRDRTEFLRGETVLDRIQQMAKAEEDWQEFARSRGIEVSEDRVLLEIRLDGRAAVATSARLEGLGIEVHGQAVPSLMNAWVPVQVLERLRAEPGVFTVRPARRARTMQRGRPEAGSVTSEGIALSGVTHYHDWDLTGDGIVIAVIDTGFAGYELLQDSGDWPEGDKLRRFEASYVPGVGISFTDCDLDSCDNYESRTHGAATVEIAYDTAPGATFVTYRISHVLAWYGALLHASNYWDNGGIGVADVISVSLGAPLDGIGDGSACPDIWVDPVTGLCGTIAEASEIARAQGSLVVNAAGNARMNHWGGEFTPDVDPWDWSHL